MKERLVGPRVELISLNSLRFSISAEHFGFFHAMEPAYKIKRGAEIRVCISLSPALLYFLETWVWQTKVSYREKVFPKKEL